MQATFTGANKGQSVTVTLVAEGSDDAGACQILGVTLTAQTPEGPETYRLGRRDARSPQIRVDVSSPNACALPRIILSPDLDAPGRVAAALESSRNDPPFTRATPHALWLLGAGE